MKKINYNFYTQFKQLIKTFNTPLLHPMIKLPTQSKEIVQAETALAI